MEKIIESYYVEQTMRYDKNKYIERRINEDVTNLPYR